MQRTLITYIVFLILARCSGRKCIKGLFQFSIKKEGCAKHPSSEDNTELNKLKDYFIVPSVKKR